MTKHSEKPCQAIDENPNVTAALSAITSSSYYEETKALLPHVQGRRVVETDAGHSGYVLYFDDGTSLIAFVRDDKLRWLVTKGAASVDQRALISNANVADVSSPLKLDAPYADQRNSIASAVNHARGQVVETLAYGDDTYNVVFPGGMELDAWLLPSGDGQRCGLRVFWEQW